MNQSKRDARDYLHPYHGEAFCAYVLSGTTERLLKPTFTARTQNRLEASRNAGQTCAEAAELVSPANPPTANRQPPTRCPPASSLHAAAIIRAHHYIYLDIATFTTLPPHCNCAYRFLTSARLVFADPRSSRLTSHRRRAVAPVTTRRPRRDN